MPDIWVAADPGPAIAGVLGEKLKEIDARIDALRQLREQLAARIMLAWPLINSKAPTI